MDVNRNKGFYEKDKDHLASSVHWTDGDYHYILEYQIATSGTNPTKITKEELIKAAESFK